MEVLVAIIIFLFPAYFLIMRTNKAIADKRNDRKIIRARKAIEDAGYLLGIENLVYDLLYTDPIEIYLSLNCHELNDRNIDMALKSLTPYAVNHVNKDLPDRYILVIWILLGFCYIRKKDFRKAINFLIKLRESTALWVSYCHSELKEYEKAITILQGFPDEHTESKILLAVCFANLKRYELGTKILKKIIKNRKLFEANPNKLKILRTLGEIYEEAENYTQALECYEQIYMEDISFDTGDGVKILDKINSLKDRGLDEKSRRHIPQKVRDEVWRRDQGRCVECGSQINLEFDHIIPVSKGGSNTTRNIRLLCEGCNRKKSDNI